MPWGLTPWQENVDNSNATPPALHLPSFFAAARFTIFMVTFTAGKGLPALPPHSAARVGGAVPCAPLRAARGGGCTRGEERLAAVKGLSVVKEQKFHIRPLVRTKIFVLIIPTNRPIFELYIDTFYGAEGTPPPTNPTVA